MINNIALIMTLTSDCARWHAESWRAWGRAWRTWARGITWCQSSTVSAGAATAASATRPTCAPDLGLTLSRPWWRATGRAASPRNRTAKWYTTSSTPPLSVSSRFLTRHVSSRLTRPPLSSTWRCSVAASQPVSKSRSIKTILNSTKSSKLTRHN